MRIMSKRNKNKNKGKATEVAAPIPVTTPAPVPEVTPVKEVQLTLEESQLQEEEIAARAEKKKQQDKEIEDLEKPPVDKTKIPEGIKKNVDSRKAAKEVLEFLEQDYNGVSNTFWEVIRDKAIEKAGYPVTPPKSVKPMSDEDMKEFLNEEFPRGKGQYQGKKVKEVIKKDREYLIFYMNDPSRFQKQLRSFFARKDQQKAPAKK